jgi:hypothetical protein
MSKKVLNTQSVINELRGQSAFFRQDPPLQSEPTGLKPPTVKILPKKHPEPNNKKETRMPVSNSPTNLRVEKKDDNVSNNDNNPASMQASMLARNQDDIIETIRKTVKQVGKDTLFVRVTPDEKHQVTSVVYALNEMYRGEGRKTSENEIGRIGVNFLLEDYKANGKGSILAKVLSALNA